MRAPAIKAPSAVVRVNRLLRAAGIDAKIVRGRGYYYMVGEVVLRAPYTSLYVYWLTDSDADFALAADHVCEVFDAADITVPVSIMSAAGRFAVPSNDSRNRSAR